MIINNSFEGLELGVASVKLDVSGDPAEVKELLNALTAQKTKRTRIIIDDVEELQLDGIRSQPKKTLVKCIDKKKPYPSLSTWWDNRNQIFVVC